MRPSSPPLSTGHDTLSPASQTAIEDQEKQSPTWVIPVAQHILPHPPTQLMARRMDEESQGGYSSSDSLPTRIPAEPLILDDSPMEDEENEAIEDLEEEIVRQRVNAARALFHRPPCENDTQNSTRSLYDTDVVYLDIHGRRYCGDYYQPNDEDEQTRLQILHGVYLYLLNDKLTTVPLSAPEKILDIGTGTGEWAIAIGEEYPDADVIGTDIAKIQPSAVPMNVYFEIDDAEEDGGWTWPDNEFDLVHFRSMSGAFRDWRHIYAETYRHLKPGGWVEVVDFDDHGGLDQEGSFRSFFSPDSEVAKLIAAVDEAATKSGRPRGIGHLQEKLLKDLGFVDVSLIEKKIPMGIWPEDKEVHKIGIHFLVAQLSGIEAICLRLLTEQAGWDVDEVRSRIEAATETVRKVALDPQRGKGLGFRVRILSGRKPDVADVEGESWVGECTQTLLGRL